MSVAKMESMLTRKQVAEWLNVSTKTVRRLELRGSISRISISRVGVRYLRKDVEDFIASRRVERSF